MLRKLFCARWTAGLFLVLLLATPALAESIVFPRPGVPPQTVYDDEPTGSNSHPNSLAPLGSEDGKSGSLSGNSITINDGTVPGGIFGAVNLVDSEALTGNKVVINGGSTSKDWITGALHYSGSGAAASDNSVVINGGTINGNVTGARGGVSGTTGNVIFTGNSVIINGGNVEITGTGQDGNERFDGAFVYIHDDNGVVTATGNSVSITGGNVKAPYINGGYITTDTGASINGATGVASNNSVSITGGTVDVTQVIGGRVNMLTGGTATATGNSVFLQTGKVSGYVLGGVAGSTGGLATATGNSVSISKLDDSLDLSTATIAGGFRTGSPAVSSDFFSGNTLNVRNTSGETLTVKDLQDFEQYKLVIPSSHPQNVPVITATGTVYLDSTKSDSTKRGSTITASTVDGAPLAPGSNVTLIQAATLSKTNFTQERTQGKHGATLLYNWALNSNANALGATLDSVEVNPQAKALSEGFLSGLALSTHGADLVAGQGMGNAVDVAAHSGFGAFGAISGGRSRYNTGSHVDMSSLSLLAGLAFGADTAPGRLTLGAFFEFGTGSYDTDNSFSNAASVRGEGETYYTGGGLLGRMDFRNTGPGRFYTEASARMGRIHNDYNSSDLRDALDRKADFESSSLYYGLHFGTGYIWNISEAASLDLYGKYFWTRQQGDSVTLSTDDPVDFEDADSHRLRGGARFSYAVTEQIIPYIGAAYEHELDGKAKASTYGYDIDSPELTGGTGIGEVGLTIRPSAAKPVSFDLGAQGYVGQREGVTGNFRIRFEF